MEKLIKLSEFYYVIDTEADTLIGDYTYDASEPETPIFRNKDRWVNIYSAPYVYKSGMSCNKHRIGEQISTTSQKRHPKLIASTNLAINLPIIQNIGECIKFLDREVKAVVNDNLCIVNRFKSNNISHEEFIEIYGNVNVKFDSYYDYDFKFIGKVNGFNISVSLGGNINNCYKERIKVNEEYPVKSLNILHGCVYDGDTIIDKIISW